MEKEVRTPFMAKRTYISAMLNDFQKGMQSFSFSLPLTPMASPRPRHTKPKVEIDKTSLPYNIISDKDTGQEVVVPDWDKLKYELVGGHTYMPSNYTNYKENIGWMLKGFNLPKEDIFRVDTSFYFPYPKSEPKKNLIEGARFRGKRNDRDNLDKTILDALEECGLIENDGMICDGFIKKRRTTQSNGRIEVTIYWDSKQKQ